jgi:apolipoprotein N-acyltransferase
MVSFHNSQSELVKNYQKSFLIPGGEYIPYIYHIILFYSGNTSLIQDFKMTRQVNKATNKEQALEFSGVRYGSLACSGAIAPSLYSGLARDGAQVLTNSASISTLGVSPQYYRQATQMSKFIAVANARPFIQSARGGSSYILNKDGYEKVGIKASRSSEVASTEIVSNKQKSPYTILGEWVVGASLIAVLLLMLQKSSKKRSTR